MCPRSVLPHGVRDALEGVLDQVKVPPRSDR